MELFSQEDSLELCPFRYSFRPRVFKSDFHFFKNDFLPYFIWIFFLEILSFNFTFFLDFENQLFYLIEVLIKYFLTFFSKSSVLRSPSTPRRFSGTPARKCAFRRNLGELGERNDAFWRKEDVTKRVASIFLKKINF